MSVAIERGELGVERSQVGVDQPPTLERVRDLGFFLTRERSNGTTDEEEEEEEDRSIALDPSGTSSVLLRK